MLIIWRSLQCRTLPCRTVSAPPSSCSSSSSGCYQTAALGRITPEQGRREKIAILDRYRLDSFNEKCWRHTRQLWKNIEAAGSAYAHDRTVENADRFHEAVYGMKPKGVN